MDDQNRPSQAGEPRTYRFISDRFHKENLSGRVRAACVTCRRRKVKCEGVEPCRTCNEKGLVCEGLPKRKTSDQDAPLVPNEAANESRGVKRSSQDALLRPNAEALHKDHKSDDSGYESIKAARSQAASPVNIESTIKNGKESQKAGSHHQQSPRGYQFINETLTFGQGHSQDNQHYFDEATRKASAASTRGSLDQSKANNSADKFRSQDQGSANLMTTARALEEQARSLRLMAIQQGSADCEDQHSPHSTTGYSMDFMTQDNAPQSISFQQPLGRDTNSLFPDQVQSVDFPNHPGLTSGQWWSLYNDVGQHQNGPHPAARFDSMADFSGNTTVSGDCGAFDTSFTNNIATDCYSWQFPSCGQGDA